MARIDIKSSNTGGGGGGGNLQLAGGASMTTTLTAVTDTSNVASPLKLSTAAVQVTSPLRITTSDASGFYLDAEDSATNNRFSIKRDPSSQEVTLDFASNPTGSTALVGAIRTYGDGVNLSNAMSFREDGNVGIGTDTPGAKLDIHSAGATVAQFNKTGSGNSYIQQLTAGAAKWKHGFTSASGAFDIIDDVNALTRLSLLNTGQLKLNAYTSTSAFTGTTAGFLAFDASGNILSVASPATSPSGVAGSVQFSDGTAFASDATNFFWNNTTKRLGIGTNAPTTALQIGDGSTGTNSINLTGGLSSKQKILFSSNSNTAFQAIASHANNGELDIISNATIRFGRSPGNNGELGTEFGRINSSGLSIGTTTQNARLQVVGSGSTSATTSLLVQNSSGSQAFKVTDDGVAKIGGNGINGKLNFGRSSDSTDMGTIEIPASQHFVFTEAAGNGFRFADGFGKFPMFLANGKASVNKNAIAEPCAQFEVVSTTGGILFPRMTTAQKNAISTPLAGNVVYDTTLNKLCVYTTAWETITSL